MAKSGNTSKRGSETIEIWRHELSFNPSNIKRHSDREIKLQVKNIRKNGYLGGIVYNVQSHALVDGHRRVAALDIIHKYYVETQENDYKIKVEQVDFDEKTEKEKRTNNYFLVQAATLHGAVKYIEEAMSKTMIDYVIAQVAETQIMDVFEHQTKTEG